MEAHYESSPIHLEMK
jgi:hypothetical protein